MAVPSRPDRLEVWRPAVPGVREVLHAELSAHAYPLHVHDEWTLLLIDRGTVDYRLNGESRVADASTVTVLPPHVAHDGHSATPGRAFAKRVVYLDPDWIEDANIGAFVDRPLVPDTSVAQLVARLHRSLAAPGDESVAESLLGVIRARILRTLGTPSRATRSDTPLAARLRDLLDARLVDAPTLKDAGRVLGATPEHLIRAFTSAYGIPPHRYLIGRRVDAARRLLRSGVAPAEVAARTGFVDQSHLTRTFRRTLGTTPARLAAADR